LGIKGVSGIRGSLDGAQVLLGGTGPAWV